MVAADEMDAGRTPTFRKVTPRLRRLYTRAEAKRARFGRRYIDAFDEMVALVGKKHALRVADSLEADVRW